MLITLLSSTHLIHNLIDKSEQECASEHHAEYSRLRQRKTIRIRPRYHFPDEHKNRVRIVVMGSTTKGCVNVHDKQCHNTNYDGDLNFCVKLLSYNATVDAQ